MKPDHRIFFAIPFDSATKNLYDRVSAAVRTRYPGITTIIGSQEIGPSPKYSDFVSFKAQNRELTAQFVGQIQEADIVVADLTHNNPNVHVELGIALMQNKNVLRVTGRSLTELGFDIRNLDVYAYKSQSQLTRKISNYLDTFFEIKMLPISRRYPSFYREEPSPIHLAAMPPTEFAAQSGILTDFVLRDGAIRVEFEILAARRPDDWFGIYFRVGASPFMGSHLVYVRQNGDIDIAVYPGPRIIATTATGRNVVGNQVLFLEFENNYLEARLGRARLRTRGLSHQIAGRLFPAAYNTDVDVHSLKVICRDTVE